MYSNRSKILSFIYLAFFLGGVALKDIFSKKGHVMVTWKVKKNYSSTKKVELKQM